MNDIVSLEVVGGDCDIVEVALAPRPERTNAGAQFAGRSTSRDLRGGLVRRSARVSEDGRRRKSGAEWPAPGFHPIERLMRRQTLKARPRRAAPAARSGSAPGGRRHSERARPTPPQPDIHTLIL
jgi:hypothetical protein